MDNTGTAIGNILKSNFPQPTEVTLFLKSISQDLSEVTQSIFKKKIDTDLN